LLREWRKILSKSGAGSRDGIMLRGWPFRPCCYFGCAGTAGGVGGGAFDGVAGENPGNGRSCCCSNDVSGRPLADDPMSSLGCLRLSMSCSTGTVSCGAFTGTRAEQRRFDHYIVFSGEGPLGRGDGVSCELGRNRDRSCLSLGLIIGRSHSRRQALQATLPGTRRRLSGQDQTRKNSKSLVQKARQTRPCSYSDADEIPNILSLLYSERIKTASRK
jgi:hypothetical protein